MTAPAEQDSDMRDLLTELEESIARARADTTPPAAGDPFGRRCTTRGRTPVRRGRIVAYYRGRREQGAWVLWNGDELHRPRWEPASGIRECPD